MEVRPARIEMKETDRKGTAKRKREMQGEDLRRLLHRLDPNPARAAEAYEKLRQELVRFFYRHQHSTAEELADAALDEVAKKPDSYEIKNVAEFAVGVARFVRMESLRKSSRTLPMPAGEDFPATDKDPEHTILQGIDREQKEKCFLQCIESFKPEERWLILEYYPAENRDLEGRRQKLAAMLGIDTNALTSRMNRLRAKLVKCCTTCYGRDLKNC
ncbi:MAG TPA: hypothetical protein VFA71_00430 [Terriglobales bacterium]|nr:hypothetical protein [Terriglobales bacterium]